MSLLPSILENHGDYSIFKTLLYPCFKKETLVEITSGKTKVREHPDGGFIAAGASYKVRELISAYLRDSCMALRLSDL